MNDDDLIGGGESTTVQSLLPNLSKYTGGKAVDQRNDWIDKFRKRINQDRVGTKYKPLPFMAVSRKLAGTKTEDMYWLYQECKRADNFSKVFFGKLK